MCNSGPGPDGKSAGLVIRKRSVDMFNSLKLRSLFLSTALLFALAGTPAIAAAEHSVPWYLSNAAARSATLATCEADPGDLASTPDCINAKAASRDADTAIF